MRRGRVVLKSRHNPLFFPRLFGERSYWRSECMEGKGDNDDLRKQRNVHKVAEQGTSVLYSKRGAV